MQLIIAGGRNYRFTNRDRAFLHDLYTESILSGDPIIEEVCGGAAGADTEGAKWARSKRLPVVMFPADWKKYGLAAGMIRNREMAQYASAVVLFSGGRGTASMFREAEAAGLKIFDRRKRDED